MIAYRRFLTFRDRLVIPNALDFEALVDRALEQGIESESVEFKATWRADFGRFLATDEVTEFPKGTHEIVKAIGGLLNAPQGGVLMIGLAELDRYKPHAKEKAAQKFPLATDGNLAVVGFEFEQLLQSVDFLSWDTYRNSLLLLGRTATTVTSRSDTRL
ncbi:MAG: hypothetical protein LC808_23860 [Actinobacteria bacterium]|nr:hypothetical protein [Actinomycetota bacterium]